MDNASNGMLTLRKLTFLIGCIPTIDHFFGDFLTVRRVVLLLSHLVLLSVSRISFANFFRTGVLA